MIALATAIASVAVAPKDVELAIGDVDTSIAGERSRQSVGEALHARVVALHGKARSVDDLTTGDDGRRPPPALQEQGALATTRRAMARLLSRDTPRIVAQFAASGDHVDVLLREEPGGIVSRSRVARGPATLDRALDVAAREVLLAANPLAVASIAIADASVHDDAARLGDLRSVLARDPASAGDPLSALVSGLHEAAQGRCGDALAHFARVVAARPAAVRARVMAADCHARLGDRDRAMALLAAVAHDSPHSPAALSLAGQAYLRIGRADEAYSLLRTAHAHDAKLADNATAIGEALLALHRPAEALAWLQAHPAAADGRLRWLAALGVAQVRSGAGPAAQATATALRSLDPATIEATRIDAELAAAAKSWPRALGRFGALRLVAPRDGAARAGEGHALLGLRRPMDAVAAFRGCADVAPWLAECRLGLGIAMREADQAEAALGPLADAASLDGADPRIAEETARTLRALLRADEAWPHAQRAELLARRLDQRLVQ